MPPAITGRAITYHEAGSIQPNSSGRSVQSRCSISWTADVKSTAPTAAGIPRKAAIASVFR